MKKVLSCLKCCVCDQNAKNDDSNETEYGPFKPLSNGKCTRTCLLLFKLI